LLLLQLPHHLLSFTISLCRAFLEVSFLAVIALTQACHFPPSGETFAPAVVNAGAVVYAGAVIAGGADIAVEQLLMMK
jgi:hypothetical protein